MKISASELHTLLIAGESAAIEYKRCGEGPKADTFESICAFLNKTGGDVILGVEDDGTVVGLPPKGVEAMIRQIVKVMNDPNLFDPVFTLYPEEMVYKRKHLIYIHVPESPEVHRFKGVCYTRVHEADVKVKGTEPLAQMFIRKQRVFTEQKVFPLVTKKDLRLDLIPIVKNMAEAAHLTHPWCRMSADAILRSANLVGVDAESGRKGFKAAAVLLLGSDDCLHDLFPAVRTDALLRRVNKDRYDDRVTVDTNLVESFDRLVEFGQKHLPDKFHLEGRQRISLRDKILREMISNVLVHREFTSSRMARFVIEDAQMFTDNANRALRYGTITPENLEPMSKNPIIANFFHQIGLADELGSGVRNLYRFTKLYSGATPLFEEDDIFRITVPLVAAAKFNETFNATLNVTLNEAEHVATNVALKLSAQEQAVVRQIQKDATVSQAEIAEKLHLSRQHVNRVVKRLKSLNVIVREGSKKMGQWKLNFSSEMGVVDSDNADAMSGKMAGKMSGKMAGKMAGKNEPQERVETKLKDCSDKVRSNVRLLLDHLKAHPASTTADLADHFQWAERSVHRYVRLLKEHGFIKRVGAAKGGYWEVCKH